MIEKLQNITEKYIEINKNNPIELKKYELIKKILQQKDCFLNMDIEHAYSILRDLGIQDSELKSIYIQLI